MATVKLTPEQLAGLDPTVRAAVEALTKQANQAAGAASAGNIRFKVSAGGNPRKDRKTGEAKLLPDGTPDVTPGGAVSVYGLTSQYPVTLFAGQAVRFMHALPDMVRFMRTHKDKLSVKEGENIDALLAAIPSWIPGADATTEEPVTE